MRGRPLLLVLFLAGFLITLNPARAWVPVDSIAVHRLWFHEGGDSVALAYETTHDLQIQHPEITRVIINIHGSSREAEDAMDRVIEAGDEHDRPVWEQTAVICPQFLFQIDLEEHEVTEPLLYWDSIPEVGPSWCYGDQSDSTHAYPRPFSMSSFACLDSLAELCVRMFPNLENLVFVGHSAGGRFMQRYPMLTRWDLNLNHPRVLYNPANPAVYAYVGPERYVDDNWNEFAIPRQAVIDDCPAYNGWPFGFDQPSEYFAAVPLAELHANYTARHMILWLSELDTLPMEGGSQDNCMAMLTGDDTRLQRGEIFWNHIQFTYGGVPEDFVKAMVPGLGHQGNLVYQSPVGRYYLFDYYHPVMPGEEVELGAHLTVAFPTTVGGVLTYDVRVTNGGEETRSGDIWTELQAGDGTATVLGWEHEIVYEPGMDYQRTELSFYVPNDFPLGSATLYFYVGDYPDAITASDQVQVLVTSTTDVEVEPVNLPPGLPRIASVAPNPFNASASVVMVIPRPTALTLRLYDVLGREAMTIHNGAVTAGEHLYTIHGDRLAGGLYFLRATAPGGYKEVRKVLLVP